MDHPQRTVHDASNNGPSTAPNIMPNILFREIHKNAFLKRHSSDRRAGFPRKSEKVWVVFCVHDDVEAFLEIYPDQKLALTHKPDWFTSLSNALHVSPSICGHEDEFEFAVTLTSQVVRLAAPSWESMMEWVDTIRNKLRELKVLSPKENIYSKMPEQRQPLLPTRDPNSPLPLPPEGPSTLLPGVEPVHVNEVTEPIRSQRNRNRETTEGNNETVEVNEVAPVNNKPRVRLNRAISVPESPSPQPSGSNVTVIQVSSSNNNNRGSHSASECGYFNFTVSDATNGEIEIEDVFTTPPLTPKPDVTVSCDTNPEAHYEHVFVINSSEIKINDSVINSSQENNLPCTSSSSNGENHQEEESGCISLQTQTKLEKVNIPGLIPRVPAKSSKPKKEEEKNLPAYSQVQKQKVQKVGESSKSSESHLVSPVPPRRKVNDIQLESNRPKPEVLPHSSKAENAKPKKSKNNINDRPQVSNNQYRNEQSVPSTSGNNGSRVINNHNNNVDVEPLTATVQPAVGGVISVEDIPLIGGHQRRRRRSSSSDAGTASNAPPSRGIGGADRIRVNVPLTVSLPLRDGQRNDSDRRPSASEAEVNSHINLSSQSSSRLTLREQQVLQLRKEMMHPGGVRLQLRRKDCIGSIALVDVMSGVWVAGWKQKEHPILYNALHIGDQLISVSDVVVRSSADAQKLLRSSSNLYIEFIIRRVPFGRVFALQKSSEGQNLGIVQEGSTAEIKDVLPNSIAARGGLPPKTTSMDGLSLTTFTLTEINGRPLNLFFKDNEVRDRLNAVGKEISILVQPSDFIKQIKKHLKNIRSYKEYIVQ